MKDRESRKTLMHGKARGDLYPLPCSTTTTSSKQVLSSSKNSTTQWPAHLGHHSSSIVRFVLSMNNLPCSSDLSHESVCDACQQAKSHQLPYPKSSSVFQVSFSVMLVSLMILASSHGSTFLSTNLTSSKS
jgi:hypothetical protein